MLKIRSRGNPGAYFDKYTPDQEEASEKVSRSGDPDAADSVYTRCDPTPYDGDPDAILEDDATGEQFRYDYGDGQCYTMGGDALPQEYVDRVMESGLVPHGNASTSHDLKVLIANVEPLVGCAENVTLDEEEERDEDE